MKPTPITIWIEVGLEEEIPTKLALCNTCDGKGSQALHGIALTQDDLADWSQDEMESYCNGEYDTPCETCGGPGRVSVIDEDRCTPKQIEIYRKEEQERWEDEACQRAEQMMGA